jgi:hypothetical protein
VLIQWCLKGIAKTSTFGDTEAQKVLTDDGLRSTWLRNSLRLGSSFGADSHAVLSQAALDAHVNNFWAISGATPYISLSAGCRELDPSATASITYTALETALSFATQSGACDGYVFRLWVMVSPKPAPELPGLGEEIRELNLFSQYAVYHDEGEIAAKLFVPARQIEYVEKYDANLTSLGKTLNTGFVPPDRISNVIELL